MEGRAGPIEPPEEETPIVATLTATPSRVQVRRLAACDGPLACHAIQECLHRYVCICAAAISRRNVSPKRELDEWFASVLETVMDCIRAKGGRSLVSSPHTSCARGVVLKCDCLPLQLVHGRKLCLTLDDIWLVGVESTYNGASLDACRLW